MSPPPRYPHSCGPLPLLRVMHPQKSPFATFRAVRSLAFSTGWGVGGTGFEAGASWFSDPKSGGRAQPVHPHFSHMGRRPRPEVGLGFLGSLIWTLKKRQIPVSPLSWIVCQVPGGACFRGEPSPPISPPSAFSILSAPHPPPSEQNTKSDTLLFCFILGGGRWGEGSPP